MFPAPDPDKCVAYRGTCSGIWFVISMSRHHSRFISSGNQCSAMTALANAARAARYKGWIE